MRPYADFAPTALAALAVLISAGCDDMLTEASVLDAPRVLAVRATPAALAPGEPLELEALTWRVTDLTWAACAAPWTPTSPPSCPTGAIPLGDANPLAVTAPEDLDRLWVLVTGAPEDAGGDELTVLPAIRELSVASAAENPTLLGLETEAGEPLPDAIPAASDLTLRARLAGDPTDPPRVVTFYTSAGTFSPFRTFETASTTLTSAEAADPDAVIVAVLRDPTGGIDWLTLPLAVLPSGGAP